ncbi:nuclease-related domain-containing protein [Peribacillus asahii]|uniref:NERD domain-containing protein n=1 Tax=Peribacillus asahii TaxID=228899 RepID=A0A3T0KY54_9BACI|nr:nuclease-related domain-containing protein [Peribacillus asahii]AZV45241.1 NERD domain-containing protein [Peribacillus asahii]USK84843.1 NERD domain-containing protein [Peribacillus asahii]
MAYKSRTKSSRLLILKSLNIRMNLSDNESQQYFNLEKGYEGEGIFDTFTEKLQCECLILNDLLLKMNGSLFQIDSLIITSEAIYFYEVKNYEGDYYYESDRIYKNPKFEIINPINQLSRSESLLRQLLHNLGFNLPINASVVFINPEFTLYQSPLNKPFIFPTQVNRYLNKLNKISLKLNEKHKMLADKLVELHIEDSPFQQLPPYDYDQLRKGMTCVKCDSFAIYVQGHKCICKGCGHKELAETTIMQSVEELKLLFPKQKITTNLIYDWCKVVKSKKRIRRILEKNYKKVGVHQWSFYQ